jgi:hypothetical protein
MTHRMAKVTRNIPCHNPQKADDAVVTCQHDRLTYAWNGHALQTYNIECSRQAGDAALPTITDSISYMSLCV